MLIFSFLFSYVKVIMFYIIDKNLFNFSEIIHFIEKKINSCNLIICIDIFYIGKEN